MTNVATCGIRPASESNGGSLVDLINQNLLTSFSDEYDLDGMPEEDRFERFAAFSMIRQHYARSFALDDVSTGQSGEGRGGDTALDAVAIIVNNQLVTDIDAVDGLIEQNGTLDATFIFIQAERSTSFDVGKLGQVGVGVVDFFSRTPTLVRNEKIQSAAAVAQYIFERAPIFKANPACFVYYVTNGKLAGDNDLSAQEVRVRDNIMQMEAFRSADVAAVGAEQLREAYYATKRVITRTFDWAGKDDLPAVRGVSQAILGFVTLAEFVKIITDSTGAKMLPNVFDDNLRDFQGPTNTVNNKMAETLNSEHRDRFVLMNNGVTIIAKSVTNVGVRFTINDFQIVNGCQTSNVIFDQRAVANEDVYVPLRLIETKDEAVIDSVIAATNSQSPIKAEQYFARLKFSRDLERFFSAIPEKHRIFYERRDGQYDAGTVRKARIIPADKVIRAFAGMYLEVPHSTTRGYTALLERMGRTLYGADHKHEPYYVAAYALFKLEPLFKRVIPKGYKPARYHILLALRLLVDPARPTRMNSRQMEHRANRLKEALWDDTKAQELFEKAVKVVERAVGPEGFERDHVRTIAVRNRILAEFGRRVR
jgi:hypothetical protein